MAIKTVSIRIEDEMLNKIAYVLNNPLQKLAQEVRRFHDSTREFMKITSTAR